MKDSHQYTVPKGILAMFSGHRDMMFDTMLGIIVVHGWQPLEQRE
jgi:hypothetical protein